MRFGATVYLSPLIALAQRVAGVVEVKATLFRRFNDPDSSGLAAAKLLRSRGARSRGSTTIPAIPTMGCCGRR